MPGIRRKINLCACGCGILVSGRFKRGHAMKTEEYAKQHSSAMKENDCRGPLHHSWKGGQGIRDNRAYIRVNGRYRLRARLVMEGILGRKLLTGEVVHHKDKNTMNDSPENLSLETIATHTKIHRTGVKHTQESKEKMSRNRKGICVGQNNPLWGKHHSEETKRKISETKRRQVVS